MITSRGWWFLVLSLAILALGVLAGRFALTLVGLALFLWFITEWLRFGWHAQTVARGLGVQRELWDERGPVDTLWAGRVFQVRVALRLSSRFRLPYVRFADRMPFGAELATGKPHTEGALASASPLTTLYQLRCPATGRLRFEGVRVELADPQGFFYHVAFVHDPVLFPVLPALALSDGRKTTLKRFNVLPAHGIHRFRRPGAGSELLDLRDYRPGDPPKTIAWKVSARRDRLITKDFESEVPVRCTLFVDTSHAVRLGPPGQNALAHLVELAATVAQADVEAHDWTGLCLFDETRVTTYVRPARGNRHLLRLLNVLADAAGSTPATGEGRLDSLLPLAYAFAEEVYPEQLRPEINYFPPWLAWLSPKPAYTIAHPSLADRIYGRLPIWLLIVGIAGLVLGIAGTWAALYFLPERLNVPAMSVVLIVGALWLLLVPALRVFPLFFPRRRRWEAWRKRLAALLSVRYGLAPGGLALLMQDDQRFIQCMQQFLAEHHVPYPLPLYDRRGRYLFASPGKVEVLARALLHGVGKGHDNELFVLLVDLLELPEQLEPLLRAIKVALARHHQVMIICPWPPEVELPENRRQDGTATGSSLDLSGVRRPRPYRQRLVETMLRATTARLHQAFFQLRRTFARVGVPVLCARGGDPARLVLDRINRLRAAGRKR
jgi:uncharacterized protein (DUF58 family)